MIRIELTEDTKTCYALRHTVFVQEQGYSAEGEVDELDRASLHLLAKDGALPVATARVHLEDRTAKVGRVCVLPSHRGTGLGADMINHAVALAAKQGARRVILGAQAHAIGFYTKLAFSAYGPQYDDEGEPHQMMERRLL